MTILVTGGAGYIGSHTCVELLDAGYDILVADNFSNSDPEALERVMEITGKDFPVYKADLLDRNAMKKIFMHHKIEAVIHFAGLKAVGESVTNPLRYYENNIAGTLVLCSLMAEFKVTRMVFSSSATVYGLQEQVPLKEDLPVQATNPYGRTKHMVEDILRDLYGADRNWSIAILRYFNPIGAHASGKIGEAPLGIPNNLLPYISQVAVGKLLKLNIFGNDYPTRDGTGIRDYIHVEDLAKGHLKALQKVLVSNGAEAYNLGTGRGCTVLEIVRAFEHASGKAVPYDIKKRRAGDIAISFADPSKAEKELNWRAEKNIYDMCLDSWRWQKNNPEGYGRAEKTNNTKRKQLI